MSIFTIENGVSKELKALNAVIGGATKTTNDYAQVNGSIKRLTPIQTSDIDHIEFSIEGDNFWQYWTGSAWDGTHWTAELSDYSGKCDINASGNSLTVTAYSLYQCGIGETPYLVLKDGSRIHVGTLTDLQTRLTISGTFYDESSSSGNGNQVLGGSFYTRTTSGLSVKVGIGYSNKGFSNVSLYPTPLVSNNVIRLTVLNRYYNYVRCRIVLSATWDGVAKSVQFVNRMT